MTAAAGMVAILLLIGVGWRMAGVSRSSPFGTTTGEIIVGSPEVYSRERLVNDRFQQTTWLEQQLRLTDKQDWSPETIVQSRKGDFVSLAAGVRADPHAEAVNGSTAAGSGSPAPGAMTLTAEPAAAAREVRGPRARSTAPEGDLAARADGLPPSPIDLFRDKLAFRDEVRAASLETQLDDRHDIAGNTLYRVKFGITVIPEEDTSAWAVVYVELSEPSHAASRQPTYAELYREWLEYYQDQLNYELDRLTDRGTRSWQPDEFRLFSTYVAAALKAACSEGDGACSNQALVRQTTAALLGLQGQMQAEAEAARRQCEAFARTHPGAQCASEEQLARKCETNSESPRLCPWTLDGYTRLDTVLKVYREVLRAQAAGARLPTAEQFFRKVVAQYLIQRLVKRAGESEPLLWRATATDCDIGLCRIALEAREGAVEGFAQALRADQVFAYAVSPKESVQRIANLTSAQRQRQLALRATLDGKEVPGSLLGTMLEQSQKDDSLLNTVLRKPLVVGFAEPDGVATEGDMGQSAAAFGWIIGPKFDIAEGGARFRHVTIENDVSAIISVPSWWKWAEVKVSTCWIDERAVRRAPDRARGLDAYADCKRRTRTGDTASHLIRLPGNVTEVARKLGLDVVRRPSVFNDVTMTVTAEKPADVLIRGNHLWRSTVVTLEGQPADNITVLPDMKGIVARFEAISRQWVGADRRLWVFTSEGEAYAGTVTVEPPTDGAARDLTTRTATNKR